MTVHRLGRRDRELIGPGGWVAQQYAIRSDLLAILLGVKSEVAEVRARGRVSERTMEATVSRWRKAGWVSTKVLEVGREARLWVWPAAAFVKDLPQPRWEPTRVMELDHLFWSAAARLMFETDEAFAGLEWTSDRLLRGSPAARGEGKPDGLVEMPDLVGANGIWRGAVEVQLSRLAPANLRRKVDAAEAGHDRVFWVCAGGPVHRQVSRAVSPRAAQVLSVAEVAGRIGLDRG